MISTMIHEVRMCGL